jgi:hypothetical protein
MGTNAYKLNFNNDIFLVQLFIEEYTDIINDYGSILVIDDDYYFLCDISVHSFMREMFSLGYILSLDEDEIWIFK